MNVQGQTIQKQTGLERRSPGPRKCSCVRTGLLCPPDIIRTRRVTLPELSPCSQPGDTGPRLELQKSELLGAAYSYPIFLVPKRTSINQLAEHAVNRARAEGGAWVPGGHQGNEAASAPSIIRQQPREETEPPSHLTASPRPPGIL